MPIRRWDSGETQLLFDGEPQVPFWVSRGGKTDLRDAADGGVSPLLAARSLRSSEGAVGNIGACEPPSMRPLDASCPCSGVQCAI